MKEEKELA